MSEPHPQNILQERPDPALVPIRRGLAEVPKARWGLPRPHLLVEPLLLNVGRAEVPVEIESALSDGYTKAVPGQLPQAIQGGCPTLLGVVRVDPRREVHTLMLVRNLLGLSAGLQVTPCGGKGFRVCGCFPDDMLQRQLQGPIHSGAE